MAPKKTAKQTAAEAAAKKQQQKKGAAADQQDGADQQEDAEDAVEKKVEEARAGLNAAVRGAEKLHPHTKKAIGDMSDEDVLDLWEQVSAERALRKDLKAQIKALIGSKSPAPRLRELLEWMSEAIKSLLADAAATSHALQTCWTTLTGKPAEKQAAPSAASQDASGGVQPAPGAAATGAAAAGAAATGAAAAGAAATGAAAAGATGSELAASIVSDMHAGGPKYRAGKQFHGEHVEPLVHVESANGEVTGIRLGPRVVTAIRSTSVRNGEYVEVTNGVADTYNGFRGKGVDYQDAIRAFDRIIDGFHGTVPGTGGFYPVIPTPSKSMQRFAVAVVSTVALCRLAAEFRQCFAEPMTVYETVCRVLLSTSDSERRVHFAILGEHVPKMQPTPSSEFAVPACFQQAAPARSAAAAPARSTAAFAGAGSATSPRFPCSKCKQPGHFRKECPLLKRNRQSDGAVLAQPQRAQPAPVVLPPAATRA